MIEFSIDPTLTALGFGVAVFLLMLLATHLHDRSGLVRNRQLSSEASPFQDRESQWDDEAIFVETGPNVADGGKETFRAEYLDSGKIYEITKYRKKGTPDQP